MTPGMLIAQSKDILGEDQKHFMKKEIKGLFLHAVRPLFQIVVIETFFNESAVSA